MKRMFPGAILGLALVVATSGMSKPILNGYQPKGPRRTTTTEPQFFIECALFPWLSWCVIPADPKKILQPDTPICGSYIGPCPEGQ